MHDHAVRERPKSAGHGNGADFDAVLFRHILMMKNDSPWHAEATLRRSRRKREVHRSRQNVGL